MNFGWEIAKITFYLILIVGVIYAVAYFLKKRVFNKQGGRYVSVIDRIYLNSKSGLLLVEIQNKIILIGQTEEKISQIAEWEKEEFDGLNQQELSNIDSEDGTFKKCLKGFLQTGKDDEGRDQDE